jgi:hypothetical protein
MKNCNDPIEQQKRRERHQAIFWWGLVLFILSFGSGWWFGSEHSFFNGYFTGYNAAGDRIAKTIKTKMPELEPFYISDLGIRFIPRGNNIASMRFITDAEGEQVSAKRE